MNVITKIKKEIQKLLCLHEWSQSGDILCFDEQINGIHDHKYYCELRCEKCGAVKREFINLPH